MLAKARSWLRNWLYDSTYEPAQEIMPVYRAKVGQREEKVGFLYAPQPNWDNHLIAAAMSIWVYTAIQRIAEMAVQVHPQIRRRESREVVDNHPLLELIGLYGQPNDGQDSLEFLEQHFQQFDLHGNVFWHFVSADGRRPTEIYLLEPSQVRIVPGTSSRIQSYTYNVMGREFALSPESVVHFKRPHLLVNSYYGMSAMETLAREVKSDNNMLEWNAQLFSGGFPSGMIVLPSGVDDKEVKRIQEETEATLKERRRVLVMRAPSGGDIKWHDAVLQHREMEFREGRILTRQAVFDALGFHVGLLSEASTEAHAKVAERQVLKSVWLRHQRTVSAMQRILKFYPASSQYEIFFEDVRANDWEQELNKVRALENIATINELRTKYYSLQPIAGGDKIVKGATNGNSSGREENQTTGEEADDANQPSAGENQPSGDDNPESQSNTRAAHDAIIERAGRYSKFESASHGA